tara:strand:+ start:4008 stop:4778 length:771 start_codon:yes stop_codon:yes gene_type:complete
LINIRNQKEINLIKESSGMVFDVLESLNELITPGASPKDLDLFAENYIKNNGGTPAFKGYMGFPSTLCISVNEEVVHGIPSERLLKNGDIVSIDCGVLKNGFYGDSARTYAVGKISKELNNLLDVTKKSLSLGIKSAKTGGRLSDIGYAIQKYVEDNGFSVVRDLVGHGIGENLHEEPQIPNYGEKGEGIILKEGMCFAIEPMVNMGENEILTKKDGWTIYTKDMKPSAHFEHTIVVRKEGGEILSTRFINQKGLT